MADDYELFINLFNKILRRYNNLLPFEEFNDITNNAVSLSEQALSEDEMLEYKAKYLDIYDEYKADVDRNNSVDPTDAEIVKINDDVIYETDLLNNSTEIIVDVKYILNKVATAVREDTIIVDPDGFADFSDKLEKLCSSTTMLRSKKDLIKEFIENLRGIDDLTEDLIDSEFNKFINENKEKDISNLIADNNLKSDAHAIATIDNAITTNTVLSDSDISELLAKQNSLFDNNSPDVQTCKASDELSKLCDKYSNILNK